MRKKKRMQGKMSVWYWEEENAITLFMWLDGFGWYFYSPVVNQWFPGEPDNGQTSTRCMGAK